MKDARPERESDRAVDPPVDRQKIGHDDPVINPCAGLTGRLRQNWFERFAVDLDVPPAARQVIPLLIREDRQPPLFDLLYGIFEQLGHRSNEVFPHQPARIFPDIFGEAVDRFPLVDIGVDRIHPPRQTAAPVDVRLFQNRDGEVRITLPRLDRSHAASRPAADD